MSQQGEAAAESLARPGADTAIHLSHLRTRSLSLILFKHQLGPRGRKAEQSCWFNFYLSSSVLLDAEPVILDTSHEAAAALLGKSFCARSKQSKLSSDQILSGSCTNPPTSQFYLIISVLPYLHCSADVQLDRISCSPHPGKQGLGLWIFQLCKWGVNKAGFTFTVSSVPFFCSYFWRLTAVWDVRWGDKAVPSGPTPVGRCGHTGAMPGMSWGSPGWPFCSPSQPDPG